MATKLTASEKAHRQAVQRRQRAIVTLNEQVRKRRAKIDARFQADVAKAREL